MRVSVISVGYVDTDILVTIVEAVEQDIPGTEANIIPEIVSMPPDAYSSTEISMIRVKYSINFWFTRRS